MRPFVILLTIVAFGWHAVVGCCAHHVHADEDHVCTDHVCETHAAEADHLDEHCDRHGDQCCDHSSEHEHSSCHEEECALLLDGKSLPSGDELSEQSRASDASAWLLGDWLGLAPPTDALDVARWQPPERDVVPAVRRHLFLQVLLT